MTQVFISYSRRDKKFVEKLAQDLEGKGYDVWFDLTDISGGERWAQEIQQGIQESDYFVIVVSENSIKSEWVEKEYVYASSRDLLIIPLLLEQCDLPIWLMNIQYIEMLSRRTYEEGFQKIINVIDGEDHLEEKSVYEKKKPIILWASIGAGVVALALILWGIFSLLPTSTEEATKTPIATATDIAPTKTQTPTPQPEIIASNTPEEPTLTPTALGESTATPLPTEITDESEAAMVLIPSGNFMMGSDRSASDEKPAHIAQVSDFYIDKYEVSTAQYRECVLDLACDAPSITTFFFDDNYDDHPVVFVDWNDANRFCSWRDARLPTEAEWEKAARGTTWNAYPWGNTFYGTFLNFCDINCTNDWKNLSFNDGYVTTAPVGSYEEGINTYGIYDMAGNVTEWVSDWYSSKYYRSSPTLDPPGAEEGSHRVLRGGSWYDAKEEAQTFSREHLSPNSAFNYIGFRCAVGVGE